MSRCKACNKEIDVKFILPDGAGSPLLESLCYECLLWADVAKQQATLNPPTGRRKPNYDKLPWEED